MEGPTPPPHRHERFRDGRMELCPDVALDLRQCRFVGESCPIRAVGRHCVEAVGDDEEVRRKRQLVAADAVIAAAVHSLVMKLAIRN